MVEKNVKVKVVTDEDLSGVEKIDNELSRLKQQRLQLKIDADKNRIEEVDSQLRQLELHLNYLAKGKTPIDMDTGEIAETISKIDDLKNKKAQLILNVNESELQKAKGDIEDLDDTTIDLDVNNISTLNAIEGVKSGIDGIINSAGEAGSAIQEMVDVSAGFEQNKSFLKMNIGPEQAATAMDEISKIVADAPGDDLALNSILVASKSKEASLNYQDMTKIAYTAADYMQGMAMIGKNAAEAQQDMRSYIIAGNTAEIERSPILQDHIDKLEAAKTPMERQQALAEALKEEGYEGIANQDTMINKQAEFEGAIERSKMKLGDMFMPLERVGMDLFMGLNDATDGVFGAIATGITGLAGPLANTGLSVAQFGASIKTITGAESVFEGLSGMVSGLGGSFMTLATGPVGIAIAAIVALGIAIYEIGKYFGWWTDVSSMFDALKTGVLALWDAFMSNEYVIQAIDLIKQGLTDAWNAISGFGQAIMSALGGGAGEFDILGFMIQNLQMILNAVGPYVILAIQGIIQVFRNLYTLAVIAWPYISQAVSTAMSIIGGVVNTGKAIFSGLMSVWNQCSSAVQSMANTISGALSAAGSAWNGFKDAVMKTIQPIIDGAKQVGDAVSGAMDWITGGGGIGTPTINTGGYSGAGYGTPVPQGNTFIFNMYGDIKDEKTLDDTINAIDSRLKFESLSNGVSNNGDGTGAI